MVELNKIISGITCQVTDIGHKKFLIVFKHIYVVNNFILEFKAQIITII